VNHHRPLISSRPMTTTVAAVIMVSVPLFRSFLSLFLSLYSPLFTRPMIKTIFGCLRQRTTFRRARSAVARLVPSASGNRRGGNQAGRAA
jgi:hypothetical protein